MSGMCPQPAVAEGSMAAGSMRTLAESRSPLPGNGEAAVELQRDSVEAVGTIKDAPAPPQAISGGMQENPTEGLTERLAAPGCVWKDMLACT